jgi:hypothetical protein
MNTMSGKFVNNLEKKLGWFNVKTREFGGIRGSDERS